MTLLTGFLTRGNIIGETSILTGRPGHKTFVCATVVETLFIARHHVLAALRMSPPGIPMSPRQTRVWHYVAIRQAIAMMHKSSEAHGLSLTDIVNHMVNSYILDGSIQRSISINDADTFATMLVRGHGKDFATGAQYAGPCLLPSECHKFISNPNRGQVILLVVRRGGAEESPHYKAAESQAPDELMDPNLLDDDALTLSSGSDVMGPQLMTHSYYKHLANRCTKVTDEQDESITEGETYAMHPNAQALGLGVAQTQQLAQAHAQAVGKAGKDSPS